MSLTRFMIEREVRQSGPLSGSSFAPPFPSPWIRCASSVPTSSGHRATYPPTRHTVSTWRATKQLSGSTRRWPASLSRGSCRSAGSSTRRPSAAPCVRKRDVQSIRCHCRRGALRRVTDGDAPGQGRLPGAGRRSGHIPQRHDLDAPYSSTGRGVAAQLGTARPGTATGCPPIDTYSFDFGAFTISGTPGTEDAPAAFAPRRTVLDKPLVDAASEAGAEVREGFTVSDLVFDDDRIAGVRASSKNGPALTEHARVVVGADGWHSRVARIVRPDQYHDKPRLQYSYYTYYSGLPMDGRSEVYIRPDRAFAAWPTNDGLTLVIGGWPFAEFEANKRDIEGNYRRMFELVPPFAERIRAARREARFVGMAVPNFLRAGAGGGVRQPGSDGRLRSRQRRGDFPRRVPLRRERRACFCRCRPAARCPVGDPIRLG